MGEWLLPSYTGTYGVMELQPGQVNWGALIRNRFRAVRLWMWSVFAGGSDLSVRIAIASRCTAQSSIIMDSRNGRRNRHSRRKEYETFIKEIRELETLCSARNEACWLSGTSYRYPFNHENSWSIERQKQNRTADTFAHMRSITGLWSHLVLRWFCLRTEGVDGVSCGDSSCSYQLADKELVNKWIAYENAGNLCWLAVQHRKTVMAFAGSSFRFYGSHLWRKWNELCGSATEDPKLLLSWMESNMREHGRNTDSRIWFAGLKATYANEFYEGGPAVTFKNWVRALLHMSELTATMVEKLVQISWRNYMHSQILWWICLME